MMSHDLNAFIYFDFTFLKFSALKTEIRYFNIKLQIIGFLQKIMSQALEESSEFYKNLYQMMVAGTKNVMGLKNMLTSLRNVHLEFSQKIKNLAQTFHLEMAKETMQQQDTLLFCNQFLGNYLIQFGESHKSLAQSISSQILQPYEQFVENFRRTNRASSEKAKSLIIDLDQSRKSLLELQENYWSHCQAAEKSSEGIEQTMDLIEKGQKTESDLIKITDQTVQIKMEAQESMNFYQKNIQIVSKKWDVFENEFPAIFQTYDYNNESRISFSKTTIHNLIKLFNSSNLTIIENDLKLEEQFKELEEKFKSVTRSSCLQSITQGQNPLFKDKHIRDDFISYESWKQFNSQLQQDKNNVYSDFEIVGEAPMNKKQKQDVDAFIKSIFDDSQQQLLEHILVPPPPAPSSVQQPVVAARQSTGKEVKENIVEVISKEELIISIVKNSNMREYFLDQLWTILHEKMKTLYLSLNQEKFVELTKLFIDILEVHQNMKSENPDEFYQILKVVTRIVKQSHQNIKEHIGQKINHFKLFQNLTQWSELFQYINEMRVEEKKQTLRILKRRSSQNLIQKNVKKGVGIVKKGLNFGQGFLNKFFQGDTSSNSSLFKNQADKEEQEEEDGIDQQEISYMIMQEINLILINLDLPSELTSDMVIQLAKLYDIKMNSVAKLLQQQENQQDSLLRSSFYSYKTKKERFETKTKKFSNNDQMIFSISKALDYLCVQDNPIKLLFVCKEFNKKFEKKIYKIFLMRDIETETSLKKNRAIVWCNLLQINDIKNLNYKQMKANVAQVKELTHVQEIIQLDVSRSLHIHSDSIDQSMLCLFLRTFAHHNQQISYCQGMNYIAGFVYMIAGEQERAYQLFHNLIYKYHRELLQDNFENLKTNFYIFERLMSIFLPELSEHFKQLGIDGIYYTTSWFITVFTSVFQYTKKSHLVVVIWDIFLAESWKGFFQCTIYILKLLQSQLLQMGFDEILHYMSDLIKNDLFTHDSKDLAELQIIPNIYSIQKDIAEIQITNSIIAHLKNEFTYFSLNLKKKLSINEEKNE